MAAELSFDYAPACNCGPGRVHHDRNCAYQHYVQGFTDAICAARGKHLRLEHLNGTCARCGRLESGTIPS